jgi:hypothetical protein
MRSAAALAAALVISLGAPALAGGPPTGVERALLVAASTLQDAGASHLGQENRAQGLERAQAAIAAALARGTGNGNGFGRGHAAEVHAILLAGGSPSELAGEHGEAVRMMVHAYNALRRELGA